MVNGWQRSTRAYKATEITTIELGQFKTGNGELISINQFEILKNTEKSSMNLFGKRCCN